MSTKSRWLRKKLYLEEFAILGFHFSCKVDQETCDQPGGFTDGLIEFIENRKLYLNKNPAMNAAPGFFCSFS